MSHWQMFWWCLFLLGAALALILGGLVASIVIGQWWRGHQHRCSVRDDADRVGRKP